MEVDRPIGRASATWVWCISNEVGSMAGFIRSRQLPSVCPRDEQSSANKRKEKDVVWGSSEVSGSDEACDEV